MNYHNTCTIYGAFLRKKNQMSLSNEINYDKCHFGFTGGKCGAFRDRREFDTHMIRIGACNKQGYWNIQNLYAKNVSIDVLDKFGASEKDIILHNANVFGRNIDDVDICPMHRHFHLGLRKKNANFCYYSGTTAHGQRKGKRQLHFDEVRNLFVGSGGEDNLQVTYCHQGLLCPLTR